MRTYEKNSTSPDGWNVTATLELTDDGRFSYSEGWTDYTNASLSGGAGGTWRQADGVIYFRAERVYPPMYFPWVEGRELIARLRNGDLEFEYGWTLSPPPPPPPPPPPWEYVIKTPVSNTGTKPLTLVLEPWGIRHTVAPGERVQVVAQGRWGEGGPRVESGTDEVVFHARDASWATVVPEPPPPAPPKPKPRVTPKIMAPVEPVVGLPAPRFVPRAPSPELAALLRRWIDELPAVVLVNRIQIICKENDAIPLDANQFEVWALGKDGQVLYIDHDSCPPKVEPVEDADTAYDKIELGMKKYPELLELLPPDRGWPS